MKLQNHLGNKLSIENARSLFSADINILYIYNVHNTILP